jgi:hypothetical protein
MRGKPPPQQSWMRAVLRAAGLYNLAWGLLVVSFPLVPFQWARMAPPRYPELWQCLGMIVGVYGLGYLIAAASPHRYWPLVLVGLLGKVFGLVGFLLAALSGRLPWVAGWTIVSNDLVWSVPFGLILYQVYRDHLEEAGAFPRPEDFPAALSQARDQTGQSLAELSARAPTLVVFLRHLG